MKLFITGAAGYIGGSVAAALLAHGHQLRGLTRSESGAAQLSALGIEPVLGTLDDAQLLSREAGMSDGVINTASADHAGAVQALVTGLEGSGKPLLHTSGSSVVGDDARGMYRSTTVFDEFTPLVVNPMKQARRDIDLKVMAAASSGVRSAVICPSLIYGVGKGLKTESVQIPFLATNAKALGRVQIVGPGSNVWSNVHLDDVVALYLLALTAAPAGAFYFAENGEASFADVAAAIAKRLGIVDIESVPAELAANRWGEAKAYFSLGSNSRVRAMRARKELGWTPVRTSLLDWITREMPV